MIDNIRNYYVYLHVTLDGIPFYVGKGKGNRAFVRSKRSVFWKNIVSKHGYNVILLEKNLTNDESVIIEKHFINFFGRRDKNTGTLVNFTDGGDGGSLGQIMTEERRNKHKKALSGKTYVEIYGKDRAEKMIEFRKNQKGIPKPKVSLAKIGKERDEETKAKISESLKGRPSKLKGKIREDYRKPVYQISINGDIIKEWSSLKEVYECLGIQISRALKLNKTCNGFYWKYKN